jgi:hypothetical protein
MPDIQRFCEYYVVCLIILLIQNAKQVPLIDTKWLKKMHAKKGVMGHVCPIVSGAADLGKKGLLIPEVN